MSAVTSSRRHVPWAADVAVALLGASVLAGALLGLVRRFLGGQLIHSIGPAYLPGLLTLVAGVVVPGSVIAGLVVHLVFRRKRPVSSRMLWPSQSRSAPLWGATAAALVTVLLFPLLLPLYWQLVRSGQSSPLDSFVEAAFPLVLVAAVHGGVGAFLATQLHRPRKRGLAPELPPP